MWIWRKMEKISWTAKVSNTKVLNRVEENRCIINMINQQKRRWLGHVLRHDVLLRDILKGRMTGKCTRGRKRLQLMSNICEGYETAKKWAEDRCLWCVAEMGVSDLLNSRIPVVISSHVNSKFVKKSTSSDLNETWCDVRGRWDIHDDMTFKVIQGQSQGQEMTSVSFQDYFSI